MSCSQLVDIEDLVLETIEPARARELRLHVEGCTACRNEQAAVIKERALFTHREAVTAPPSAALAAELRAQLTAEAQARPAITGTHISPARRGATRFVRRGASALGEVLRRGHLSAGAAALLFALVAFSKLGGAPILPAAGADSVSAEPPSGPLASMFRQSFSEDTLVCSLGSATTASGEEPGVSSGMSVQSSSSGATSREVLACRGEGSSGRCEPSVTCSSLRQ